MYRAILSLTLLALSFFSPAEALIAESNDFAHTFTYHKEDILYVFDIDNTLLEMPQHLGSDPWFSESMAQLMKKESLSRAEAAAKLYPTYIEVMHRTKVCLVEPSIAELLLQMRKKNVPMIGLTKRHPRTAAPTLEQMASLEIDFSTTCPLKEECTFQELAGTLLKKGVIFVGQDIDKGAALLAYLKKLKKMPARIVAIDDKLNHIESIASAVEPLGIDYIGIRYGRTDEKLKSYNPKIAAVQLEYLKKILSDEQALQLLKLQERD